MFDPDKVDHLTHEVFTCGDCWVLARTLHRKTGWDYIYASTENGGWAHVGVITPDGKVLDIEGLSDRERWSAQWGALSLLQTQEGIFEEVDPMWDDDWISSAVMSEEIAHDMIDFALSKNSAIMVLTEQKF